LKTELLEVQDLNNERKFVISTDKVKVKVKIMIIGNPSLLDRGHSHTLALFIVCQHLNSSNGKAKVKFGRFQIPQVNLIEEAISQNDDSLNQIEDVVSGG
jgi:hypothetical protein